MIQIGIRRIKPEHELALRTWMAEAMRRQDEVRETFAREGVRHEQAFILKTPEGPILIYATEVGDQAAAIMAFEKSTLPVDQEHKRIMAQSLGERPDVELVFDCAAAASRSRDPKEC